MICNANVASFGSVLLKPVPASFRPFARLIACDEKGLNSKSIIVFFDSGSDGTFITENLRKDLFIKGRKSKLDIAGMNNEKPWDATVCNIPLRNPDNPEICITLKDVYSINNYLNL